MEPTLGNGDRVLVERISTRLGSPDVGDVVVFHPPAGAEDDDCGVRPPTGAACAAPTSSSSSETFVKRIVAGPGDHLRIRGGIPTVNGERVDEPFARPCDGRGCDFPTEIVVPADHYFVMGDNRAASDDSRYWGPVPEDSIIGEIWLRYWPPDDFGAL